MKKIFFLFSGVIILSLPQTIYAQSIGNDSLKDAYEHKTICLDGNNGAYVNRYIKSNQKKRIGLFGKRLHEEFANSSLDSKQEMETYIVKRKKGFKYSVIGGAVIIVSALVPVISVPVFVGIAGASLIPCAIGTANWYKANNHLQKAVWLYNRDVLVKK